MTEQVFNLAETGEKTMERVLQDGNIHLNHMVLPQGEGFPGHAANATVYMTVMRGRLSITLNDQPPHAYPKGTVLKIPLGTQMRGTNEDPEVLELLIVKAPAPGK